MRINRELLPVKIHNFLFYAAMGPIIAQMPVYGKELGISSVVMGTIVTILPFAVILARPGFCALLDVFRDYRKSLFMLLIAIAAIFAAAVFFIPTRTPKNFVLKNFDHSSLDSCNNTDINKYVCKTENIHTKCSSKCLRESVLLLITKDQQICELSDCSSYWNYPIPESCDLSCYEEAKLNDHCLYSSLKFWAFIVFMTISVTLFYVINSISDAICFDMIGKKGDFGRQKVWSVVGFGTMGFVSGYFVDNFSSNDTLFDYNSAVIIVAICSILDIIVCANIELPIIEPPKNIVSDVKKLLQDRHIIVFMIYATFMGILDVLTNLFLLWYLEDFADRTSTENIKLIEGLAIAAGNLGSEILFFMFSGKILNRFSHVTSLSLAFLAYSLRLWFLAIVPSPWWVILIEFVFHGPSFAFSYTIIANYAHSVAPPGASATIQGILAGIDDSVGFVIGSFIIGLCYQYIGTGNTLQVFSIFSATCGISYFIMHKTSHFQVKKEGYEEIS